MNKLEFDNPLLYSQRIFSRCLISTPYASNHEIFFISLFIVPNKYVEQFSTCDYQPNNFALSFVRLSILLLCCVFYVNTPVVLFVVLWYFYTLVFYVYYILKSVTVGSLTVNDTEIGIGVLSSNSARDNFISSWTNAFLTAISFYLLWTISQLETFCLAWIQHLLLVNAKCDTCSLCDTWSGCYTRFFAGTLLWNCIVYRTPLSVIV